MKTQNVRLLDVFVLGPLLLYAGLQRRPLPRWLNVALVVSGVLTILYNGNNYLLNRKETEP